MARPVKNLRTISKNLALDEDLVAKMELECYSEVEQRIPLGAQSKLVNSLLRKHYRYREQLERKAQKEGAADDNAVAELGEQFAIEAG